MNPYQFKTECDVCGGPAVARVRDIGAQYCGAKLRHTDPEVCADHLRQKRKQLDKALAATEAEAP